LERFSDFSSVQRSLDLEAFSIQALKQKPPKIEKINFQDLNELPPPEKPKVSFILNLFQTGI